MPILHDNAGVICHLSQLSQKLAKFNCSNIKVVIHNLYDRNHNLIDRYEVFVSNITTRSNLTQMVSIVVGLDFQRLFKLAICGTCLLQKE